ncbi:MAG: glycosyltransferase family 4 protein [Planctomycetaceae bacterium]|nr:glycosyltransferase family 4 protein [Planctomycetaceae bacterium]
MPPTNKECLKMIQLTPGAGEMYCGNCLRDNALVVAWNQLGHDVSMLPLYLPLTLDEPDQSEHIPVFFGGVNVFMSHKLPKLWRLIPHRLRRLLDARSFLKSLGKRVSKTDPAQVGDLTVSMLKGEEGNQLRELQELADWLQKEQKPDVISFSNALLLGMSSHLRKVTGAKTVCFLTGEDSFLDTLPEPHRTQAWNLVRDHVKQIDLLIAPSRYYADLMTERLGLPKERIHVVHNGINTAGFDGKRLPEDAALTLGFFARMCTAKGLDVLVDAFIEVRKRGNVPNLQLKIGGNLNPWNEPFVGELKQKLESAGFLQDVHFYPNVSRTEKIEFLQSLDVLSVPAVGNEPFGFYVIEALAAGVPVVLPSRSAFPELVERSGGGVLYLPDERLALVEALEALLADEAKRRELSQSGRRNALEYFCVERAARESMDLIVSSI